MSKTITDAQIHDDIALRLICGEESVLEDILRLPGYAPAIAKVLCQKYRGYLTEEDIRDVIVMAVTKLWEHRERYDDSKGSVRSYLHRIADNTAKDIQKHGWFKAKRLEVVIQPKDEESDPLEQLARIDHHPNLSPSDDPDSNSDLSTAIQDSLKTLRDEYRYILEADAYAGNEGVTLAHLAERLRVPVGTVKAWRSRAKEAFRKELKSRGYDLLKGNGAA
jgi:RNA polymerase sigma factor (sigma-70 family)